MNSLGDSVSVRFAGIDEAATVVALLHEAFAEYERLYTPAAFSVTTPTAEQLRARWAEGPVWIVWIAGRALGTVAAVLTNEGLYVRSMAVSPEGRGRGVGRLLLEQVENFARQCECKRLFLSTTPFLHRAIQL